MVLYPTFQTLSEPDIFKVSAFYEVDFYLIKILYDNSDMLKLLQNKEGKFSNVKENIFLLKLLICLV